MKKIEVKEKDETGNPTEEKITKYKWRFFDKDLKKYTGYTDENIFEDFVSNTDLVWNENLAHKFKFETTEYDGIEKEKLVAELV